MKRVTIHILLSVSIVIATLIWSYQIDSRRRSRMDQLISTALDSDFFTGMNSKDSALWVTLMRDAKENSKLRSIKEYVAEDVFNSPPLVYSFEDDVGMNNYVILGTRQPSGVGIRNYVPHFSLYVGKVDGAFYRIDRLQNSIEIKSGEGWKKVEEGPLGATSERLWSSLYKQFTPKS